LTLLIKT
jgi:hypothetical protein